MRLKFLICVINWFSNEMNFSFFSSHSQKVKAALNTKDSVYSKRTGLSSRRPHVPLIEVQEVFDKADLNSQWDETFVTKQYYMWVPNPRKGQKKNFK